MSLFTKLGNDIASPVDAAGNPRSVENADMQRWMTEAERGIEGAVAGRVDAASWPDLSSIEGDRPGQPAIVYGPDAGTHTDPVTGLVVQNEGIYAWSASPAGWRRVGDLSSDIIHARNSGDGTADAIQATVAGSFSREPYAALITVDFREPNTGPMTLSINGEAPRPLVLNTGATIPGGYVTANMSALVQIDEAGNYRLFSYGDAEAIQNAVEQMRDETVQARNQAVAAAESVDLPPVTADRMLVDLDVGNGPERLSRTAAQVRAFLNVPEIGDIPVAPLYNATVEGGVPNDGSTFSVALLEAANSAAIAKGYALYFPRGTFNLAGQRWRPLSDSQIVGDGPSLSRFSRDEDTQQGTIEIYAATDVLVKDIGLDYTPETYTLGYAQSAIAVRNGSRRVFLYNIEALGKFNRQFSVLNSQEVFLQRCDMIGGGNSGFRAVSDFDAYLYAGVEDENAPLPLDNIWVDHCFQTGAATRYGSSAGTTYGIMAGDGGVNSSDFFDRVFFTNNIVRRNLLQGMQISGRGRLGAMRGNHVFAIDNGAGEGIGYLVQLHAGQYALGTKITDNVAALCQVGFWNLTGAFQKINGNIAIDCALAYRQSGGSYNQMNENMAIACTTGYEVLGSATLSQLVANAAYAGGVGAPFSVANTTDGIMLAANDQAGNGGANELSGANMVNVANRWS